MNKRKIIIAITILIVLGLIGYFIFVQSRATTIPQQDQTVETVTAEWKIYHNEQYGFEISYPANLEPLEGQALFYRPPQFTPVLNVCFASVNRREFYCEVEFYISTIDIKELATSDHFIGFQRCSQERTYLPRFDDVDGIEIDICDGDSLTHRNALVQKGGFTYLLTTEPSVGYTTDKDETFHKMINSFKFA